MTVLQRKDWLFMQRSTLTYSEDHSVLESRVNVHRLSPCRDSTIFQNQEYKNKGGDPEQLNHQEYGAIANGVSENLLNGKGMAAALLLWNERG